MKSLPFSLYYILQNMLVRVIVGKFSWVSSPHPPTPMKVLKKTCSLLLQCDGACHWPLHQSRAFPGSVRTPGQCALPFLSCPEHGAPFERSIRSAGFCRHLWAILSCAFTLGFRRFPTFVSPKEYI